jgi:hypothetical protein
MPFSLRVDRDRRLIFIAFDGDVSNDTLIELSDAVRSEPALEDGYGVFYDCRGAAAINVTGDLVRDMGRRAKPDTNRIAMIATTPAAFGLARMYQMLSEGEDRIRIFHGEAEALAWLTDPRS